MWIDLDDWAKENIGFEISRNQLRHLAASGQLYPCRKIGGKWRCQHDAQLIALEYNTDGLNDRAKGILMHGAS